MDKERERQLVKLLESELSDEALTQLTYVETLESTEGFSDEEIAYIQNNYRSVVTLEKK